MRVLPRENEAINECWLSDKDRFSYEGLNSRRAPAAADAEARAASGKRSNGVALDYVAALRRMSCASMAASRSARSRRRTRRSRSSTCCRSSCAASAAATSTSACASRDFRDGGDAGVPWLGMPIAEISELDRVLVVGSTLRKDHPLHRAPLRRRRRKRAAGRSLNPVDDDLLMPCTRSKSHRRRRRWCALARASSRGPGQKGGRAGGAARGAGAKRERRSRGLRAAARSGVFLLGNSRSIIRVRPQARAGAGAGRADGARVGFLGKRPTASAATSPARCLGRPGSNAAAMLAEAAQGLRCCGIEPSSTARPAAGVARQVGGALVVALSAFNASAASIRDVMLPIGAVHRDLPAASSTWRDACRASTAS